MSQRDRCFKPLFLPPPPAVPPSSSSAGPEPVVRILATFPLHSHTFVPPSLELCPVLWFRLTCRSAVLLALSWVPPFPLNWITVSKSSWSRFLLHFTSSSERRLRACPLSLQCSSVLLPVVVAGSRPPRGRWKQ